MNPNAASDTHNGDTNADRIFKHTSVCQFYVNSM